ncbi:MAG TPA: CRISPR-associated protein Cas5 [Spirochaetota bacterium]|nr:CRISPR-associated protein Cas5 [Spirochaetota bacterium]HQF90406.1 CRISPR-associated protein Cas5 [Methanofastidiosum sp.]HOM87331.1 CRISPR-associated protein Cas5 [Spirochaetota bacterium]HOR92484.1 CRISPR-associated protein Cas5 [Spirochaetota bacterium]HOT18810.1 CRISPR-associated protein Cas5 [Spirochaetota bacterium]
MLRLIIYQETAHFRIATIGNPYLTYLLPPPSTIYGFLRKITNYKSINYQNTKLSIQGIYESISLEKERLTLETKREIKTNIIPIQKLHNSTWIIHIDSVYDREIKEGINDYVGILRLGRVEDLIIDFSLEEIMISDNDYKNIDVDYFIYKKWEQGKDFKGQLFSMFIDSEVDEKLNIIGYKPVQLIYSSVYSSLDEIKCSDGKYLVSWIH